MPQTHPYGTPAFYLPSQTRRAADLLIMFRNICGIMTSKARRALMPIELVSDLDAMIEAMMILRDKAVEEVARVEAGL